MKMLLIACIAAVLACAASPEQGDRMFRLEEQVLRELGDGNCEAAIRAIRSEADLGVEPRWFFLLADSQVSCYQKTRDKNFKSEAIATLSVAADRFPHSSRVHSWTGFFAEILGESELSRSAYEKAREIAEKNIREHPDASADDQEVLREMKLSGKLEP